MQHATCKGAYAGSQLRRYARARGVVGVGTILLCAVGLSVEATAACCLLPAITTAATTAAMDYGLGLLAALR